MTQRAAVALTVRLAYALIACGPVLRVQAAVSDAGYYQSLVNGSWTLLDSTEAFTAAAPHEIGWSVDRGAVRVLWPTANGPVARAIRMRLRDAANGATRVVDLAPRLSAQDNRLRFSQRLPDWNVDVEAALVPRGAYLEGAVRLRGLADKDLPLRAEIVLEAPGPWRWWDDARRSREINGSTEYANVTRVLAGYDGQMSRYPMACITSENEGLVMGVPVLRPRVFRLSYDGETAEYRLAVDVALSPSTAKFPNEATFFFVLYPVEAKYGFRGAIDRYYRVYPEAFVKRVTREGIWMPFTRINDVRDAQDFHFGFHEYGAVDFAYNMQHGINSFLYVEPWTYWMAMKPDVPRDPMTAMEQLHKNAAEGDDWNRAMARATLISAIHEASGDVAHQFVDQPWCNGTLFFNNSDPDLPTEGFEGVSMGRHNLEVARKGVVERASTVLRGWDPYAEGYRVDTNVSRDTGSGSIRVDRDPGMGDMGAVQIVQLDQDVVRPIWINGYSRAEDVSSGSTVNYSLYADVTYQNGSNSWGHAVGFDSGSHSWQRRDLVIVPDAPVKNVKFHVLFRGDRTGRAWFDGMELKELPPALAAKIQDSPWEPYDRGFSLDANRPHGGHQCIRVDRDSTQAPGGALLRVSVDQQSPAPVLFRAWSRARDLPSAVADDDYSIFADVYFQDGSTDYGVTVPFPVADAWRVAEREYSPAKPIRSVNLHLMFRGAHTGRVWFDDVSLTDPATGKDYVVDGGFERMGSDAFLDELAAIPNRLRGGEIEGAPIELRSDGMYLDSLEGWANRLNFRAEHFPAVDIPLAYETGSGRTAIYNLFSIFEFTQAMSDYLHAHNRLLMGNWVLIDFPFLGAPLDVPGKEVHWLDSQHLFVPDPDDVMLYRRTLSGQKPYPLLLNVLFEYFTPEMMRKYFARSLFYAFYPSLFSHDAATNPYFENPAFYERDRDLFLQTVPMVKALSVAGWEPLTFATSSESRMLVERYGRNTRDGLYFAIHHDGEGASDAQISLELTALGLTDRVRLIDFADGETVATAAAGENPAFAARLGGYETRVVRVLDDTPEALMAFVRERLADLRAVIDRHEEQGKLTLARAEDLRGTITHTQNRVHVLDVVRRIQQLRATPEAIKHKDFSRAVSRAENAAMTAMMNKMGLSLALSGAELLVSPTETACDVVVKNQGAFTFSITSARLSFEPDGCAVATPQKIPAATLAPGRVLRCPLAYSVPTGLDNNQDCTVRVELDCALIERGGKPRPFVLSHTMQAPVMAAFEMRVSPERSLTVKSESQVTVALANHRDRDVPVVLSAYVEGPGVARLSWTQEQVLVKALSNETRPLSVETPEFGPRALYTVAVSASMAGVDSARGEFSIVRFPASKNLLTDPVADVLVDSTFSGYAVNPLRDGITDTEGLRWSESAWASAELAVPHWVEIRWPAPRRVGGVTLYWAKDGGVYYRSSNYRLQYKENGAWVDLPNERREDSENGSTRHEFKPLTVKELRLWQDSGGGYETRRDLLWLRELEILADPM